MTKEQFESEVDKKFQEYVDAIDMNHKNANQDSAEYFSMQITFNAFVLKRLAVLDVTMHSMVGAISDFPAILKTNNNGN